MQVTRLRKHEKWQFLSVLFSYSITAISHYGKRWAEKIFNEKQSAEIADHF
jgi:hypothetical protein